MLSWPGSCSGSWTWRMQALGLLLVVAMAAATVVAEVVDMVAATAVVARQRLELLGRVPVEAWLPVLLRPCLLVSSLLPACSTLVVELVVGMMMMMRRRGATLVAGGEGVVAGEGGEGGVVAAAAGADGRQAGLLRPLVVSRLQGEYFGYSCNVSCRCWWCCH
jgi:hypothetical protein